MSGINNVGYGAGTSSVAGNWKINSPETQVVQEKNAMSPSGDCGGPSVTMDPPFTKEDQWMADMLQEVSPSGGRKMSLNDIMSELTIMMLKNATETKSTEREMRAELAVTKFQDGLKAANIVAEKGNLIWEKGIKSATGTLLSSLANVGAQKGTEHYLLQNNNKNKMNMNNNATNNQVERSATDVQKQHANTYGNLMGNLTKSTVDCFTTLSNADMDKGMSELDAKTKTLETMNKLLESISSSVDSSIRSQDSAIQFIMNLMQSINSLAAEGTSKIINNMR